MTNEEKCKHHDKENGWCKKLSDWSDPMPHVVYCPKSPCEYAEPIEQPMNDNDIIKALGYCFAVGDCEHCIYADKPCQELMADALKLINRQKSEIEEWKSEANKYQNLWCNAEKDAQSTKTEAIKEFAERLKGNCISVDTGDRSYKIITTIWIDNLVKEMTEEQE